MKFFLEGDYTDKVYGLYRDNPSRDDIKPIVEDMWDKYHPYIGDNLDHFRQLAKSNFQGAIWHLYLLEMFDSLGFKLHKPGSDDLDIKIEDVGGRIIWVEAVAAGAGSGPDAAPEVPLGRVFRPASRQIILRHTSALASKGAQVKSAIESGKVKRGEVCVVALNVGMVPGFLHSDDGVTYLEKATLGFGELVMSVPVFSDEPTQTGFSRRESVEKESGRNVGTEFLFDRSFSHISGVLYSVDHFANVFMRKGRDLIFLHNPVAANSLPDGWFKVGIEKRVVGGELLAVDWREKVK